MTRNEGFDLIVKPPNDRFTFLERGGTVMGGLTATGHTSGHRTYIIESNGQRLALIADAAKHPVWSVAFPDWEVRFDADKAAAAAVRPALFGMLAAERVPFISYHMPFPAFG